MKWRPSLWVVLGGALGGTLALSLAGLIALRYIGPEIGFRWGAVWVALVIGALTAVLGWLLLRLLLRPLAALDIYATQVRARPSDPPPEPRHYGTREIHSVARSVMDMAATLRTREAAVRNYTNHVTHELKTPVSTLRGAAELLLDSPDVSDGDRRLIDQVARATEQLDRQLQALRAVAKAQVADVEGQTPLSELVSALAAEHPELVLEAAAGLTIPLSSRGATVALGQLVRNAVEHGATGVEIIGWAENGSQVIQVLDNGTGVATGNAGRIFDPFFTTRRETGGTGMGLWIVATLLRDQGADIKHVPTETGCAFRLVFPDIDASLR